MGTGLAARLRGGSGVGGVPRVDAADGTATCGVKKKRNKANLYVTFSII